MNTRQNIIYDDFFQSNAQSPSLGGEREIPRTVVEEEAEEEDEVLGRAETYADYVPSKCEDISFFQYESVEP